MNSTEDKARRIFGERATYYTTSATHADAGTLGRLVSSAQPQPDWRALDVATGTGHTACALAPHVANVTGLDLTPQMLSEAQRFCQTREVCNVAWVEGDAHYLPFANEVFQLVTCRRAAHHMANIQQALDEMRRVLATGGRLVIDDRSVPEDDILDGLMNDLDKLHDASHVREYRPSAWSVLLKATGFELEQLEMYIQHRPLSALTDGIGPAEVQRIEERLHHLGPHEQEGLQWSQVDGVWHLNHWYVLLAARKYA